MHRRTLQGVEDKNFAQAEWKRKENLIKEAKEAYKNRLVQNVAAMQSDGEYSAQWRETATINGHEKVRARLSSSRQRSRSCQPVLRCPGLLETLGFEAGHWQRV